MLYYIDGKVIPIMDAPSGPVYNFTKANVIDGAFSYEGTGSKTRINQCVVTWIDPEANYKASPLLVEDRLNIAKTGTIISQDAMAMGATSEGQAL
jgi:predicted phage tail protein